MDPHLGQSRVLSCKRDSQRAHQQIDRFDYVQENLILPVPNTFRSPRDRVGNCHRRPDLNLQLVRLLRDIPGTIAKGVVSAAGGWNDRKGSLLLQDLALCRLWIPEIHHLVQ